MDRKAKAQTLVLVLGLVLALVEPALSLIEVGGNEPIEDHGWPVGSVGMANLPTRVSWWAGPPFGTGSMYEFEYHGQNTDEFNEALKVFSRIRARRLELIVHNGPKINYFKRDEPGEEEDRIDWTFTIWNPNDWDRLYNSPSSHRLFSGHPNFGRAVDPPRVDVYVGGGAVVWKQVKVAENIVVIDKRPGSVSPEFAGMGLIRAEVFDMETKKPITNAEIVLMRREQQREYKEIKRGNTDNKGFCEIAHIPTGYYEIRVLADGYAAREQGNWNNDLPEFLQFKISLARPHCVKGVVVDTAGNPIAGVHVSAESVLGPDGLGYPCAGERGSTTDAQGRFEICLLPKGFMSVMCRAEGLYLKNSILEQYEIPTDGIKLVMTGTGTVLGKVVDRDGNRPAGGITLELEPEGGNKIGTWGYSGHLSADGTFKISGIPPGRYVISTRPNPGPADYEPNVGEVTIKAGKTYEVEILHEDQRDKVLNIIRKFIERRLKDER
ncbi:MAG TPA: carboxypeptidase-like regulatory domain-containing protein [Sedimentisphaerales bacterium]|nr:carboxypeptidase-like regulatory domain-containing protein [Sedimentisphaerales bacterium]